MASFTTSSLFHPMLYNGKAVQFSVAEILGEGIL